ncbi:zinc metalloproteinase-disintegrin-like kaouthiagin-like [Stylophora pistillata]|uniref:zinc metalloproteinase-disintegrin-like kaouthiagin-like n=1 Tax=Stylophora pistillata TaxID=50429 RepID=UPI000C03DE81|nr:zinc metalloproteinase-disintegrin-like kaouthiagin-like [Stylophora pistillata]
MVKRRADCLLIICALWLFWLYGSLHYADGHYDNAYHLTRPDRVDGRREKRDLSTSEKGVHVDTASYRLTAFDKDWTLDVKRNKELIHPSFSVRTFANDGSHIISQQGVVDHCHYQGSIRSLKDSNVVLNTCSGLRGLIDDGHETFYITPENGQKEHGIHRVSRAKEDEFKEILDKCGNKEAQADSHSSRELLSPFSRIRRSISGHIDEFYKPFLTTDETRYNELAICVDFEMYSNHDNDTKAVTDRVITLVNAVDAIYQRINIRIVLKVLEIWTNGDPYKRENDRDLELKNFRTYRNDILMKKFPHDNAQLLSHRSWPGGTVGYAWVNGMCGGNSNGINSWYYNSIIGPYVTLAHEMGHNFGFNHDTGTCKCLTPRGCIMGGHKTRLPGFSNCSLTSLQRVNDACLYNVPTYKAVNSYCGNGIREEGEECDCGTPEMCKASDPCCEPKNCVLKEESQCSDLHHSCCKNCLVRNSSVIQGNTNFDSVNRRGLNPKVTARYLRINPPYWNGWPCLRTDFMGCSKDEAIPTEPTPLKSYGLNLCLTPRSKNCSPNDNDPIVYASGVLCSESHFQFTLGTDGVLRHTCSGKMVCTENGGTGNSVKIVVSSTCSLEDSKFERTSGRSLKHVKSSKCLHTTGGWPGVDKYMVIYNGCNVKRLELWFGKQDCVEPLGMQNGEIKDSQITASSARKGEPAQNARLNLKGKYWCAGEKSKSEYLQVDLGEVKTVSKVLIQGRGTWYSWVTGFFLHYSDDGQRWATYTESGDKRHSNSHCYLGKCSEILETQCKDLWGASANSADPVCYDKLNTEAAGYGTCDPATNSSCAMCMGYKCRSFEDLDISVRCPLVNNEECAGRGVCTNKKECHCEGGFDTVDSCKSDLIPRDGAWGDWSSWTVCDKGCGGGKRRRHRFCNNPFPLHGGADCPGERHETEDCNTESCPEVISCHHLKQFGKEQGKNYPDGVYKIYPTGSQPIKTYCDMSRDGGGWTLLITSHTNGWTADNVRLKNTNSPKLTDDYSILQYADSIKNNINVAGSKFEYRLEAQSSGNVK